VRGAFGAELLGTAGTLLAKLTVTATPPRSTVRPAALRTSTTKDTADPEVSPGALAVTRIVVSFPTVTVTPRVTVAGRPMATGFSKLIATDGFAVPRTAVAGDVPPVAGPGEPDDGLDGEPVDVGPGTPDVAPAVPEAVASRSPDPPVQAVSVRARAMAATAADQRRADRCSTWHPVRCTSTLCSPWT
jgi:hypothetical protein